MTTLTKYKFALWIVNYKEWTSLVLPPSVPVLELTEYIFEFIPQGLASPAVGSVFKHSLETEKECFVDRQLQGGGLP